MRDTRPFLAFVVTLAIALPSGAQEARPSALVDAFEGAFGKHAGRRRTHAKGACVQGTFTPTREARKLASSPLFSGGPVGVVARFSLAGGDPAASDATRSPRGLALRFALPEGEVHQMALLSTPVFAAATPESFLGLLRAQALVPETGARDAARIAAYRRAHPDTEVQARWLATHNPPASYVTTSYFAIHAFRLRDAAGSVRLARFRLVPDAGERSLTDAELRAAPADFLHGDLTDRLTRAPATWRLMVQLAGKHDPANDPTREWPRDRPEVLAGTLSLALPPAERRDVCDALNFDPLVLARGIEPSDDPVLRIRSAAYGVSFARRRREASEASASPASTAHAAPSH